MEPSFHYSTVTESINYLRSKGFVLDFNLEENCISGAECRLFPHQFEIAEVFRYEGNTDPADEAVVYGIVSEDGQKGILVTGYGISGDSISEEMLRKLSYQQK
jgi:hypothetical protein